MAGYVRRNAVHVRVRVFSVFSQAFMNLEMLILSDVFNSYAEYQVRLSNFKLQGLEQDNNRAGDSRRYLTE